MTRRLHCNLYIASCAKDGGILHCRMSGDTLKPVNFTPLDRPMHMIIAGGKMHILLRAPFENGESGLVTYGIAEDGTLVNPSPIISTMGEVACHLTADGEDVYAVNYISGSVFKAPEKLAVHEGSSIHPTRQTSPHTHFVSLTPDGEYLFVTDLGLDRIFVYRKDLSVRSTVAMPAGHGPRHLAFHADGRHVFCANELASTVSLLEYRDGELTLIDTVNALPEDFDGISTAAAIRCVGDTVYVSNRGHDSVSVLDFSGATLTLRETIPTYGKGPRDFVIAGDRIIAANEAGDAVCVVSIDDGSLVAKLDIASPVCVVYCSR